MVLKFLSLQPYATPNLTPTFTTTGPTNDFYSGNHYLTDRQAYLGKIDQTINANQKVFVRYIWNKYRVIGSRNNVLYNWTAIDNTALGFGLPEPIDERNIAFGISIRSIRRPSMSSSWISAAERHHHSGNGQSGVGGNAGDPWRWAADLSRLHCLRQQFRCMDGESRRRLANHQRRHHDRGQPDEGIRVAYTEVRLPGNSAA